MELPVYELKINEAADSFVEAVAIVEHPAIESDFLAFSNQKVPQLFAANDERMELIGGAMIPDMKIYRRDQDGKEYNVFFSKATVRQIAQIFFKKGFQGNMNLDHTSKDAKSYIFQSYIVDAEKGMNSPKGLDLPEGSWVVGVKVEDEEVWKDIKAGKRKGFSVEGMFEFFQSIQKNEEQEMLETLEALNRVIANKLKNKS